MSIKNVTIADLALLELLKDGRTDAPPEVLADLAARGYVIARAGKPRLTGKGSRRAERLRPMENEMRLMFAAGKDAPLTAPGSGGQLRIGGGRAHIYG